MKMKKVTGLLAMTVAAVMAMTGCGGNDAADESTGNKVYHIGIIQQMEHGSLDQATKGFEDKLTELLGEDNVEFDYQNAQGEQANCTTISTKFVSDSSGSNLRYPHRRHLRYRLCDSRRGRIQ